MFEVKVVDTSEGRELAYSIRREVFVLEGNVPADYERDELDESGSIHYLGFLGDDAIGVSRVVVRGTEAQIGRVCLLSQHRGKGYGKALMDGVISHISTLGGIETLFLHAQDNVIDFYKDLRFEIVGDQFIEVGIVHVPMRRQL